MCNRDFSVMDKKEMGARGDNTGGVATGAAARDRRGDRSLHTGDSRL